MTLENDACYNIRLNFKTGECHNGLKIGKHLNYYEGYKYHKAIVIFNFWSAVFSN